MSVVIAAKFPWPQKNPLNIDDKPFVVLLSDTRLTITCGKTSKPGVVDVPKEFRLAKNLTVAYTSLNLSVITDVLFKKGTEPSSNEITTVASFRDIRRLGELLKAAHEKNGGFSEVIAVFWDPISKTPKLFELMPNSYKPKELDGTVGIGSQEVLDKFGGLCLEDLFYHLKVFNSNGFNKDLGSVYSRLLTNYFYHAIKESTDKTVGLPIQSTKITETAMNPYHLKILKKNAKEFVELTADKTKLVLPKHVVRTSPYVGGSRHAIEILKNKYCESPKFQEDELSIVLKNQSNFALKFKGLIVDNFFYLAEDGTPFTHDKIYIGDIEDKKKIAVLSGNNNGLKWQAQKISNNANCKELILDLELIHEKQRNFTVDIWAIDKKNQTLLQELINGSEYKKGIDILNFINSDKTDPIILLLLWNLTLESYANLEKAMSSDKDTKTRKNLNTPNKSQVKIGRNESCPCGSGKKYKRCCGK